MQSEYQIYLEKYIMLTEIVDEPFYTIEDILS